VTAFWSWFATPVALALLAVLPALGVVALLALRRRQRALGRLAGLAAVRALVGPRQRWRGALRVAGRTVGLVLLVAGVAGPQWGRDPAAQAAPGRDLVVLLDLSRSMRADDVPLARLTRARDALLDLSQAVQRRGGHRLALVVFAARARVACPLTHDYDHFRDALVEAVAQPPAGIWPAGADAASGTRMGEGLRKAVAAHDPRFRGHQDVLMISDGDDPARDEEWQAAAQEARTAGIPVHTVGVGDPKQGGRIPYQGGYLRHDGEEVRTRLEERPLEAIARRTGGTYTPARTQALPLGELFRTAIEPRAARDLDTDLPTLYLQRYPWFLGAALLVLAAEMALGPLRLKKATG
jgi:Ca-activated chloride channel family protein